MLRQKWSLTTTYVNIYRIPVLSNRGDASKFLEIRKIKFERVTKSIFSFVPFLRVNSSSFIRV